MANDRLHAIPDTFDTLMTCNFNLPQRIEFIMLRMASNVVILNERKNTVMEKTTTRFAQLMRKLFLV